MSLLVSRSVLYYHYEMEAYKLCHSQLVQLVDLEVVQEMNLKPRHKKKGCRY